MNKFSDGILTIIIAILILVGITSLSGLIFWGIGALIVKTFNISYNWTFWHGVCATFIISILSSIFKTNK